MFGSQTLFELKSRLNIQFPKYRKLEIQKYNGDANERLIFVNNNRWYFIYSKESHCKCLVIRKIEPENFWKRIRFMHLHLFLLFVYQTFRFNLQKISRLSKAYIAILCIIIKNSFILLFTVNHFFYYEGNVFLHLDI